VADKDDKKTGFDPKPVQIGGESILDRLIPHMKKIVIAIVITSVLLGVVFFFVWLKDRKHAKATNQLAEVVDITSEPVLSSGEVPASKLPIPTHPDHKERATKVLEQIQASGTESTGPTFKAAMLMQSGKLDDAIAEYRKGTTEPGLAGVLAREGLGLALEAKALAGDQASRQKGLEEALAAFQQMQPDEKGPRYAYAQYHQGRLLAPGLLGKPTEAKAAFEKAKSAADKDSPLVQLIDERLVSLGAS
jgi:tetratricopeptide (TPR) repeat protein